MLSLLINMILLMGSERGSQMAKISVGDVVVLKSESNSLNNRMVVEHVTNEGDSIWCVWFGEVGILYNGKFRSSSLKQI